MMKTLRFCIAGFILSVRLPEGWDAGALLPSFRPFACNPGKDAPLLFACRVGTSSETCREEVTGSLLEETVNDLGSVRLFFRAGQYEVRLRTRPGGQEHVMQADRTFTQIRIGISPRDEDAGHVLSSLLRIAYSQAILYHDALAFHASAVSRNGEAFLFMGRSGTGKSTHSALWLRHLPGTELLNDDNPTIRIQGDTAYAHGTPWSGKTPCYKPQSFPIGGMVRLIQAPENRFNRQEGADAFVALYPGCSVISQDQDLRARLYDTLVRLAERVPTGILECRPDSDAAILCCRSLRKIRQPMKQQHGHKT